MSGIRALDFGGEPVDAPIRPEWVVAGDPVAKIHQWAISSDLLSTTAIWSCTAGTFRWNAVVEEMIHILEGSVTVTDESGHSLLLTPGDAAVLTPGEWTTWTIDDHVKKHAVLYAAIPAPVRRYLQLKGRLRMIVGRTLRAVGLRAKADSPTVVTDPFPLRPAA